MAISFSTFAFNKCFKVSLSWFSLVLPMATTKSKKASKPAFCPGEPSWDNPSVSPMDHKQMCSEQTTQKINVMLQTNQSLYLNSQNMIALGPTAGHLNTLTPSHFLICNLYY